MNKKIVYIASDHGGYDTKIGLAKLLEKDGYEIKLYGAQDKTNSVSYSEIGIEFAKLLTKNKDSEKNYYVALCGSGIGISIALNRFKNIRCARVTNEEEAKLAKMHNNANILCFGGRFINPEQAYKMFNVWENTTFEGGRHVARIAKLEEIGE